MVVFVDLDDEAEPPECMVPIEPWTMKETGSYIKVDEKTEEGVGALVQARSNPNRNAVTEAFGCYPIISEIASSIDLNTLDNLSRTCWQVHENLLQFRKLLTTSTLKCCNEDIVPNRDHTLRYRARAADWYFVEEGAANVTGKVGSCARDMVSECRRCSRVICRNCTIKPPAPILLQHRHRRLCPTCTRAPLPSLIFPHLDLSPSLPTSADAIQRSICHCPTAGVWLCQPCGRGLRSADTTYESIWRWRTRYGEALGGLGTGIGEGNRSFECGRQAECLAAHQVEEEVDCDAEDARELSDSEAGTSNSNLAATMASGFSGSERLSSSPRPGTGSSSGSGSSGQLGPGYARHEIEGIGGVVKTKLVRMVRVGACVTKFEDESEQGRYLVREVEGRCRSWCGWCWRVIPGGKDKVVDDAGFKCRVNDQKRV